MHMIKAQAQDGPQLVIPTEAFLLEPEPDLVDAVKYKLSVDRDTHTSRHRAVELYDDEKLKHD